MNRTKSLNVFAARTDGPRSLPAGQAPGVLARVLGALLAVVALALAVLFSAVLLAAVLLIGAAGIGWFWWQTRAVRRTLRERVSAHTEAPGGTPDASSGRPGRGTARAEVEDISDAHIISEVKVSDRS